MEMLTEEEKSVIDQAEALAEARVAYARAFQLQKMSSPNGMPVTDRSAEYAATEITGDAVTISEAKLRVALHRLENQP